MSDKIAPTRQPREEITLVDLLAVIIRYRKVIIGSVLLGLVAAGLYYAVVPAYKDKLAQETQLAEATTTIRIASVIKPFAATVAAEDLLVNCASDPSIILASLQAAGITRLENIDISQESSARIYSMVRRRLVLNISLEGKAISEDSRLYKVTKEGGGLTLTYRSTNAAQALEFLAALSKKMDSAILSAIAPAAQAEVDSYDTLLKEKASDNMLNLLREGLPAYTSARRIIEGHVAMLEIVRLPLSIEGEDLSGLYRAQALKTAVYLVLGALAAGLLLAIALSYADKIRQDQVAMGKINKALRKQT